MQNALAITNPVIAINGDQVTVTITVTNTSASVVTLRPDGSLTTASGLPDVAFYEADTCWTFQPNGDNGKVTMTGTLNGDGPNSAQVLATQWTVLDIENADIC